MIVRRDIEFGEVFLGGQGTPPVMVRHAIEEPCGCAIICGHKLTYEMQQRAVRVGAGLASEQELAELHRDALAVVFVCSCGEHHERMNRAAASFHESLDNPTDRDLLDVLVELWEEAE